MTVHVCPIKDSECGHRPDNWCDDCPLRLPRHCGTCEHETKTGIDDPCRGCIGYDRWQRATGGTTA